MARLEGPAIKIGTNKCRLTINNERKTKAKRKNSQMCACCVQCAARKWSVLQNDDAILACHVMRHNTTRNRALLNAKEKNEAIMITYKNTLGIHIQAGKNVIIFIVYCFYECSYREADMYFQKSLKQCC